MNKNTFTTANIVQANKASARVISIRTDTQNVRSTNAPDRAGVAEQAADLFQATFRNAVPEQTIAPDAIKAPVMIADTE